MNIELYKEFLQEEEKFLKQLEKNVNDQLNRLKVEELSILKVSSSSHDQIQGLYCILTLNVPILDKVKKVS